MPPITLPSDLKPIAPFLQRAQETKSQNPIISYWCTFYALEIALRLKFDKKDNARSRFLAELMDELESEKQRLASHDAITQNTVSSAYIENFALRVFAGADTEDRKGVATKSTAKKFLAAANFLELLKIFESLPNEIDEKIRYSKWKAADIAKALREGRKPQPGPPGDKRPSTPTQSDQVHTSEQLPSDGHSVTPPSSTATIAAPLPTTPPHRLLPSALTGPVEATPINPGLWSNVATPGGESPQDDLPVRRPGLADRRLGFADDDDTWSHVADTGSRQNSFHTQLNQVHNDDASYGMPSSSPLSTAMVPPSESEPTLTVKQVRWTPSVAGGSSLSGSPPISPEPHHPSLPSLGENENEEGGMVDVPESLPSDVDTFIVSHQRSIVPGHVHSERPLSAPQPERASAMQSPPVPAPRPVELTNAIIAKVQKHCRFAISSLDYEDGEQARKELRAALALLGG